MPGRFEPRPAATAGRARGRGDHPAAEGPKGLGPSTRPRRVRWGASRPHRRTSIGLPMKPLTLLIATGAIVAIGNTNALAQHWRDGAHGSSRHYYGSPGWVSPRYYPRYAYPYSYYLPPLYAPLYSYPYPVYAYDPPPVIVERYEMYPPPPPPVHREYRERSYAEVSPPAAPPPQSSPRPALERMTLSAKE